MSIKFLADNKKYFDELVDSICDNTEDEDSASLELLTWGDDFDIDVVVDADDDVSVTDVFKIVRFVKEDCGDSFDSLLIEDVSDLYDLLNDGVREVSESEKELKRLIGDEVFSKIKNIYVKLCYFDIPCKGYGRHDVDFSFTYLKNESKARQIAYERILFDF